MKGILRWVESLTPEVRYIFTILWSRKQQRTWGELAALKYELSLAPGGRLDWKGMLGDQGENF